MKEQRARARLPGPSSSWRVADDLGATAWCVGRLALGVSGMLTVEFVEHVLGRTTVLVLVLVLNLAFVIVAMLTIGGDGGEGDLAFDFL